MENEIVLYQPSESIKLDVRVEGETVWLTQEQIALLFGTQRPAITKHLNNIYKCGELDEPSTCSILERMGNDGRQIYQTKYYNLDAILSVGYRVNSVNATLFRRWATSVLKEYILRGCAVNQRIMAVEERVDNRLMAHEQRLEEVEEKIDFFVRTNIPPVEQVFFEGQFFEARVLLENLIKTATKRVIMIDSYVDATTFDILDVRAKGVTADIYSDSDYRSLRDMHNTSTGKQPISTHKWSTASHDRWLIIDDTLYHCGHSFKDMGKKLCAIMRMGASPEDILKQVQ